MAVVERVVEGLVAVALVVGDLAVAVDLGAPCTACWHRCASCSPRRWRTARQGRTRRHSHRLHSRCLIFEYAHSTSSQTSRIRRKMGKTVVNCLNNQVLGIGRDCDAEWERTCHATG